MFTKARDWVKANKLTTLLVIIVLYFLGARIGPQPVPLMMGSVSRGSSTMAVDSYEAGKGGASLGAPAYDIMPIVPAPDYTPNANVQNRKVVQNSYLSLQVVSVVDSRKKILDYTQGVGGYMVNAETSNPQDQPTANITVRIPSERLESALQTFRDLGVKVVSENIMGYDVTDQFVDIEARVATLEKTKKAMEDILDRAVTINDLTNLTREVINIQSQIDSYRGQQKSLEENAKLAKVTIYLATDEIALPYAPSETWRPEVIIKLAVRSLVVNLRQIGTFAIWVVVYSIIWVPVVILVYFINRRLNRNKI